MNQKYICNKTFRQQIITFCHVTIYFYHENKVIYIKTIENSI